MGHWELRQLTPLTMSSVKFTMDLYPPMCISENLFAQKNTTSTDNIITCWQVPEQIRKRYFN